LSRAAPHTARTSPTSSATAIGADASATDVVALTTIV
jgi:hypothetical protein